MSLTIVLYFVGDNEESAFAGLAWDDYDDAVECAWDNGFTQVWEAEFDINPATMHLAKELHYDEEGFRIDEDEGFYGPTFPGTYEYEKGGED